MKILFSRLTEVIEGNDVTNEQAAIIVNIMAGANRDWDHAPCDPEGSTPEQDCSLDRILEEAAVDIIKIIRTTD